LVFERLVFETKRPNQGPVQGESNMGFVNEANWDRIARVIVGVALFVVGLAVGGGWGTFLAVFAFVPFLTGLVGWCPLYSVFHIRTNRDRSEGSALR
jgi:hypothetical protein